MMTRSDCQTPETGDGMMSISRTKYMAEHPEEMEEMSREVIKKCAPVVRRAAEMVVEIVNEED